MGVLTDDMQRVVRRQRLGYVATVNADGSPNVSPKGTLTVWDDDHLVFADLASPGTIANLRRQPSVEVNVVDPILRKGYRFRGRGEVVDDGPRLEAIRTFYRDGPLAVREEAGAEIRSAVIVEVIEAKPLVSPGYRGGVTEAQMRDRWQAYYADLY